MDPTAPATYRILRAVLSRTKASQRELARDLDVSLGQTNRVFRWLEENQFVERARDPRRTGPGRGREVYALRNPTGLLRAIALFRPMPSLRRFAAPVDAPKEAILADLRMRPVVLCLGSALETYGRYYRSDEISFYALDAEAASVRESLAARREGITRVAAYALDARVHGRRQEESGPPEEALRRLEAWGFARRTPRGRVTTKVQTVVDLFGDGKAFAARDLLRELWGIRL